jgi:hypothetical protein
LQEEVFKVFKVFKDDWILDPERRLDPGSGKNSSRIQGVKKHRISDPGSAILVPCFFVFFFTEPVRGRTVTKNDREILKFVGIWDTCVYIPSTDGKF